MKLVKFLVEAIFWIQIFLCPALILGFFAFVVYNNYPQKTGLTFSLLILLSGISLGVYFAERVRRTKGCSSFMSRIFASPDIDSKD